jgi:hypothetical protein
VIISSPNERTSSRRHFLKSAGVFGGMPATFPAFADSFVNLDLPNVV